MPDPPPILPLSPLDLFFGIFQAWPFLPLVVPNEGTVTVADDPLTAYANVPARHLKQAEAKAILDELAKRNLIVFKERNIRGISSMNWGVMVSDFPLNGAKFHIVGNWSSAIDPRLAVLVYRLVVFLRSEGATGMAIGYDRGLNRPEFSSHNQGRAFDFHAVFFDGFTPSVDTYMDQSPLDARLVTVLDHWGHLPVRDDAGAAILVGGAPKGALVHYGSQPRQDRLARWLDAATQVDRWDMYSVLGKADDPGEPPWSAANQQKADALAAQLRRAAKIFSGAFKLFLKEGTINDTKASDVFTDRDMTSPDEKLWNQPISRTNSGNICEPDGSIYDAHQDHLHAQIGVTNWSSHFDDTTAEAPAEISPEIRKVIYKSTGDAIWASFTKAEGKIASAATEAERAWKKKNPPPKPGEEGAAPAPRWEDQPEHAAHERRRVIASALTHDDVNKKINTHIVAGNADLAASDTGRVTKHGRVLNRYYSLVKRSKEWFTEDGWYKDSSLSVEQMKALPAADVKRKLLARILAALDEAEARGLSATGWEQKPGLD